MLALLLAVSVVSSRWWIGAFAAAAVCLLFHLVPRVRAWRSPRTGPADWLGVGVSAVGVLISGVGIVLDHPPGADDRGATQYAIIVPTAGAAIGSCVEVRGLGGQPHGHRLWTVVQSVGSGLYYPGRPVIFDHTLERPSWNAPTAVGVTNQRNDTYAILAVLLDDAVSRIWREALSTGGVSASSDLPPGSEEVARVSVIRRSVPSGRCPTTL